MIEQIVVRDECSLFMMRQRVGFEASCLGIIECYVGREASSFFMMRQRVRQRVGFEASCLDIMECCVGREASSPFTYELRAPLLFVSQHIVMDAGAVHCSSGQRSRRRWSMGLHCVWYPCVLTWCWMSRLLILLRS